MDTGKLALTRVDELERRITQLASQKGTLKAFELRNDNLYEYITKNSYTHTFDAFTPAASSSLTLILNMDLNFYKSANVDIALFVNNSKIVTQKREIEGKFTLFLTKTITIYEEVPVSISIKFEAKDLLLTIEKYSLTIIGELISAPAGLVSPVVSGDRFLNSEIEVLPYVPPKEEVPEPQDPPPEQPPEKEGKEYLAVSGFVELIEGTALSIAQVKNLSALK